MNFTQMVGMGVLRSDAFTMNLIVADVANRYQIFCRIFTAFNMCFQMMKFKVMTRV